MPLAVPLENACPLVAGRGHGQIYNSLIIRYHLTPSVESQPFFGHDSTLHFIKKLKIIALQNKAWPHPAN